jgi:hypothetical protein
MLKRKAGFRSPSKLSLARDTMFTCNIQTLRSGTRQILTWVWISGQMAVTLLLRHHFMVQVVNTNGRWISIHEIDPAPCEQWMEDYLKEQASSSSKPVKESPPKPLTLAIQRVNLPSITHMQISLKTVLSRGRETLLPLNTLAICFGKGNDESVVWETIQLWNHAKVKPSLDQAELRKTFESIRILREKNPRKRR